VRATLRALDCLDLLEALPRGLETQVGEKSAALSLGQRQLICFARALLADPRIVVLDEATSAIDSVTEDRLQRALEILLRGRTAFVVAHRLSTIRKADLVLVLDEGRIVERARTPRCWPPVAFMPACTKSSSGAHPANPCRGIDLGRGNSKALSGSQFRRFAGRLDRGGPGGAILFRQRRYFHGNATAFSLVPGSHVSRTWLVPPMGIAMPMEVQAMYETGTREVRHGSAVAVPSRWAGS